MMLQISQALVMTGLLGGGVVYGTDTFFAVVGRGALEQAHDESVLDVMGRMHQYGDARMPVFGALGLLSSAALVVTAGVGSAASWWALTALFGLSIQLAAYLTVAKPVNIALTAAVRQSDTNINARGLQQRWDSVITWRALGTAVGVAGLALTALNVQ
jgi:hypothetical protein